MTKYMIIALAFLVSGCTMAPDGTEINRKRIEPTDCYECIEKGPFNE